LVRDAELSCERLDEVVVVVTYLVKEAIKIDLPRAVAAGAPMPRTLHLLVSKNGQVYLDGAVASDDAIARRIAEESAAAIGLSVVERRDGFLYTSEHESGHAR
jgi:biopolymer transport protein ExbD